MPLLRSSDNSDARIPGVCTPGYRMPPLRGSKTRNIKKRERGRTSLDLRPCSRVGLRSVFGSHHAYGEIHPPTGSSTGQIPPLTRSHPPRESDRCIWRDQNAIPLFLTKPTQSESLRNLLSSVAWNLSEREMRLEHSVTRDLDKKAKKTAIGEDVILNPLV